MYYENRNKMSKDKVILLLLMIIIILFLWILILKIDSIMQVNIKNKEEKTYETTKLSTISEENVDNNAENLVKSAIKCVVGISKIKQTDSTIFLENKSIGLGSGVIISKNGYIVTNQHVVGNKYSNCYVSLENGIDYSGVVVWADPNIDLAIVKIEAQELECIHLGDSDKINLADSVYAIGNPIGIEFQRTITKGIISGIDRTIKLSDEDLYMEDLIQTDAMINEGNSGGALINSNGELIGINTIKISNADGIGFAIPINILKPILKKLEENGTFDEAYLGIYGFDKEVLNYLDENLHLTNGVYVASLDRNVWKEEGQLSVGDIILEIDDIKIDKMSDLRKYIYSKSPGEIVKLKVKRNKIESIDISLKLSKKQNV